MNKEDLEYFRKLIISKKTALLVNLEHFENNSMKDTPQNLAGDPSAYSFHMADDASRTNEQEIAFSLASREGRYLHHLNEALERIENNTYGKCRSCGGEIGRQRLEAVPHATQCIKCKTKEEKRRRGL